MFANPVFITPGRYKFMSFVHVENTNEGGM